MDDSEDFRKTVATVITLEYGIGRAGFATRSPCRLEGHRAAQQHYVERDVLVPDSSAALERFAGERSTVGNDRD
ncbi:hypothetical protein GCM10027089_41230 [Nocardia thraciensis]